MSIANHLELDQLDRTSRAELRSELKQALASDEFSLYFQPHIDLITGDVSGCEALIRWNHPARGLIPPGQFIPAAEQIGMITSIENWVMRKVFGLAAEFGALHPEFRLYFNLSGRQAGDPNVVHAFAEAARNGVPLKNIGVEITETDAMRDVDATRSVDDFGTGYSSLSSLKQLPVDLVKIDRQFISGLLTNPHDEAIADTIITIASRFGFQSLAEGVEQVDEIAGCGSTLVGTCRAMQSATRCRSINSGPGSQRAIATRKKPLETAASLKIARCGEGGRRAR